MKDIKTTTEIENGQPSNAAHQDWRSRACWTLKEAAVILSTPQSQLRKLCRQGKINPITSLGRKWRIATEDIEALLNERLRNQ